MINADKLKSIISKKAFGNSEISQKFYQLFYFERILERISKSKYRGQIILKGGLLLTSIIGNDDRTTKDMDATLKGISLNKEKIKEVFNDIFCLDIGDGVSFELISIKDIRLEDEYGGYRLNILSTLGNNKTYITVELTTGDTITPREMKYSYNCIFEDKKIPIMAYTIETVLSEKLHAIMSRGVLNTRLKDFYDMYVLITLKVTDINKDILVNAIRNTFKNRGREVDINEFHDVIDDLENDSNMKKLWIEYQDKNGYAKGINYTDTINAIKEVVNILESELISV